MTFFPKIFSTFEDWNATPLPVNEERQGILINISQHICSLYKPNDGCSILIVCTHNSRRSQLAEALWSMAAEFYEIPQLVVSSSGTEATAFHPNALDALRQFGAQADIASDGPNPTYRVSWRVGMEKKMFSKKINDTLESAEASIGMVAVCSDAAENCPVILGADWKLSLPYLDPKHADNTPEAPLVYQATLETIAKEALFIMKNVKGQLITENHHF